DAFTLTPGVALYGGFAATETLRSQRNWLANPTVLSGDIGGDDGVDAHGVITDINKLHGTNSLHVVVADGTSTPITSTTRLDGFTITGGNAVGGNGGGMLCNGLGGICNPHIEHVTFSGNMADYGGALFNDGSISGQSSPTLTNVAFLNNSA